MTQLFQLVFPSLKEGLAPVYIIVATFAILQVSLVWSPLCGLCVCVHTHMCMCLYTHFRHSPGRFCYVCVWSVWVGVGVICVLSVCECIHTYRCVCVCTHTYARHSAGFHVCHGTAKNKTCKKKTCLRWPNPLILIILNSKP